MSRRIATWALGALLGIVVAAAITWATSHLTAQHIGLSSEPLSAGRSLVPRAAQPRQEVRSTRSTITVTLTRNVSPTRGGTPGRGASTVPPASSSTTLTTSIVTPSHSAAPPRKRDDSHREGRGQGSGSRPHSGSGAPDD